MENNISTLKMRALWIICILWTLTALSTASDKREQRLSNLVAIVGRHFTYHFPDDSQSKTTKYTVSCINV